MLFSRVKIMITTKATISAPLIVDLNKRISMGMTIATGIRNMNTVLSDLSYYWSFVKQCIKPKAVIPMRQIQVPSFRLSGFIGIAKILIESTTIRATIMVKANI